MLVVRPRLLTGPASASSKLPVDRRLVRAVVCFSEFTTEEEGSLLLFCIIFADTASVTESDRWRLESELLPEFLSDDEDGCVLLLPVEAISSRLRFRVDLAVKDCFPLVLVALDALEDDFNLLEGDFVDLRSGRVDWGCCFGISGSRIPDAGVVVVGVVVVVRIWQVEEDSLADEKHLGSEPSVVRTKVAFANFSVKYRTDSNTDNLPSS